MSSRLSRVIAGLATLLVAGGVMACPGAKNTSADAGQGSKAQTTQPSSRS
jgi:hypothetical protein